MTDLEKRIKAFSTRPKHVKRLKLDDLLAALEPRAKPPTVAKADLRKQAEAAVAGFKGEITRLPAVDPAERSLAQHEARQSVKPAPERRSSSYGDGSN